MTLPLHSGPRRRAESTCPPRGLSHPSARRPDKVPEELRTVLLAARSAPVGDGVEAPEAQTFEANDPVEIHYQQPIALVFAGVRGLAIISFEDLGRLKPELAEIASKTGGEYFLIDLEIPGVFEVLQVGVPSAFKGRIKSGPFYMGNVSNVSADHVNIVRKEGNWFRIEDLGSKNGTRRMPHFETFGLAEPDMRSRLWTRFLELVDLDNALRGLNHERQWAQKFAVASGMKEKKEAASGAKEALALHPWEELYRDRRETDVLTDFQSHILRKLDGKRLTTSHLAAALHCNERRLFKPGGIKELEADGKVKNDRGKGKWGFYRPDAPPPD